MPPRTRTLQTVPQELRRLVGAADDGDAPPTSLGGWILQSLSRRVVMISIGLAAMLAMRASGLAIPGPVFALVGGWFAIALGLFVRYRHDALPRAFWRVHFGAQVVDLAGTIALAHLLGAMLWLAPLLMAMTVSLGGQTLPRLYGMALSVLAATTYAVAFLGEVVGWWPTRGPFALATAPELGAAIGVAVAVAIVLVAIAAVQRSYFRHVATVEQRHARVLDTTADMIVTVDRDGRYLSANAAVERALGWTRDHIIGDTIFDSIDARDRDRARAAFIEVLRGHTITEDLHIRAADESRRLLQTTGAPIYDENGQVVAGIFIGRDVSAERSQAERLAESERNLRLIVRSVNETVFTVDRDLRFSSAYGQWSADAPVSPAAILGRTIRDVIGDEAGAAIEVPVRRALAGETVEFEQEIPGATPRIVRLSMTPLRDDDEAIVGVTGVAFDVTEQRRAERERDSLQARLEESRRIEAIGRLVSGVAHELNNPLAAILTFAEQLRSEPRSPADDAALTTIYGQAIRSRAIVRDLLTFVRPGQHRAQARFELAPVIDAALRALEPHVSLMSVRLERRVDLSAVWVDGDASGIEQVVTNLVLNAAQAAGAGGTVEVSAFLRQGRAVIRVDDTGAGIAEAAFPHLFEPFFTTKPVGQGTGLGLFVSLGVAQRHGGQLHAANRAEGGARFELELPTVPPAPVQPRRQTPTPVVTTVALQPRVLLVDDEESIRHSLRRYFTRRSWEVSEAADGAAALAIIRELGAAAITLVVCDLRMPGMNGAELHAVLEREYPALLQRTILASGDVVSPEVAGLLSTTRCRVLEKPFELVALGQVADEVLGDLVPRAGAE